MLVSALYLINTTATVIETCINTRKKNTYYYIYAVHPIITHSDFFLKTRQIVHGTTKTEAMNEGDA